MAENKVGIIIGMAVVLILIGILLPIGLDGLVGYTGFYNSTHIDGTVTSYVTGTNTTLGTLVGTILPVMIVIGIILSMVAVMKKHNDGGAM